MLPVIIATAQYQPLFGPNDLRPDCEAAGLKAFSNRRRMQCAMPDIGDIAGKQRPGLTPVGAIIVQHLAGAFRLGRPRLVAPAWIVFHTVRWIADEQ